MIAELFGRDPFELAETWTVEQLFQARAYLVWKQKQEKKAIEDAKHKR